MNQIDPVVQLKERILELEKIRDVRAKEVKEEFSRVYESLQPVNLVKNALKQVVTSPEVQGLTINSLIGAAAGFIAKKAVVIGSGNPIVKAIGSLVGLGVSGVASSYSEEIKNAVLGLLKNFLSKGEKRSEDDDPE